jgi:ElaB/YqjD/DUF883 family membrane-anchored ribosome-binding protein
VGQSTEELSTQIAGTRDDLAYNLDALHDRVSPRAVIERRKAAARGRMYRMKSRVMGSAHDARHTAGSSASSAADAVTSTASDAVSTAEEKFEGSPLAAGLVAFGAGMLVSALIPATEAETRAAQQAVETAKDKGQPVMEQAKSAGQEMGQHLKESATQAAQEVKDTAAQSAEHVKQEGQTSTQQVQAEAKHQM